MKTNNKKPEVEFTIGPDGNVEIDKKNFSSDECITACDDILKAIGKAVQVKRKPEAYKKNAKRIRVQKNHNAK